MQVDSRLVLLALGNILIIGFSLLGEMIVSAKYWEVDYDKFKFYTNIFLAISYLAIVNIGVIVVTLLLGR